VVTNGFKNGISRPAPSVYRFPQQNPTVPLPLNLRSAGEWRGAPRYAATAKHTDGIEIHSAKDAGERLGAAFDTTWLIATMIVC
jgi:hypothetical protein